MFEGLLLVMLCLSDDCACLYDLPDCSALSSLHGSMLSDTSTLLITCKLRQATIVCHKEQGG